MARYESWSTKIVVFQGVSRKSDDQLERPGLRNSANLANQPDSVTNRWKTRFFAVSRQLKPNPLMAAQRGTFWLFAIIQPPNWQVTINATPLNWQISYLVSHLPTIFIYQAHWLQKAAKTRQLFPVLSSDRLVPTRDNTCRNTARKIFFISPVLNPVQCVVYDAWY